MVDIQQQIRPALPTDAVALSRLIRALGFHLKPEQVVTRLAAHAGPDSGGRVFVALRQGRLVGFLSFHTLPLFHEAASLGRITAMAVDPQHRRQGIGRRLLEEAETFAQLCGCWKIEVAGGDHREQDARIFYTAQGYRADCRRFIKRLESRN